MNEQGDRFWEASVSEGRTTKGTLGGRVIMLVISLVGMCKSVLHKLKKAADILGIGRQKHLRNCALPLNKKN